MGIGAWFAKIALIKRFYLVVGIGAVGIIMVISVAVFGLNTVSGLRAYVGAEGLWAKGQKEALLSLKKYAYSHDENHYQEFLEFLKIPLSDKQARLELEKPNIDYNAAYQAIVGGGNSPKDVQNIVNIFKRFRKVGYMDKAVTLWAEADLYIAELEKLGAELQSFILSSPTHSAEAHQKQEAQILERVDALNAKLLELENNFSATLSEASRWAAGLIMRVMSWLTIAILLIVVTLGVFLIRQIVGSLREAILQITSASNEILAASEEQAIGIEEEATQISQVATSAKELTVTAKQVTEHSNEIAKSAGSTMQIANAGSEAVNNVVNAMNKLRESVLETAKKIEGLGERSQAITEIVTLIENIADQTNLLSLNAAIEAARAGEAGKGFAVVADSIGKLAERTSKSTKEIAELIKGIQQDTSSSVMSMEESTKDTEKGNSLVQEAGRRLREIVSSFKHVADSAQEIALSSQQQASGSEQIAKAMIGVDQIMKQSAVGANQSKESVRNLVALANEFKKIIGK